jgi:hypothetical protein
MRLVFGWADLDRPLAAPPATPPERLVALRTAFDAAMRDGALIAEAEAGGLAIAPMPGAAIATFVDEVYQTPPSLAAKAAQWLGRSAP